MAKPAGSINAAILFLSFFDDIVPNLVMELRKDQ